MRHLAALVIRGYQQLLSPLLGHHCRFTPSCSSYAIEAFQKKPFFKAFYLTLRRLLKCHPFHAGGYDPVV